MLEPLTQKQQDLIVKNVVAAVKDIRKLNSTGYNFLYLASGFIAHYNIHGFKDHYDRYSLAYDIINNQKSNMWNNFMPTDENYAYYMTKKAVYLRILDSIEEMAYA
jgi:hypothetical protein